LITDDELYYLDFGVRFGRHQLRQ